LLSGKETDCVITDKAYDSVSIINTIHQLNALAVIPPRSNRLEPRKYNKNWYRKRNFIERFFVV